MAARTSVCYVKVLSDVKYVYQSEATHIYLLVNYQSEMRVFLSKVTPHKSKQTGLKFRLAALAKHLHASSPMYTVPPASYIITYSLLCSLELAIKLGEVITKRAAARNM